MKIAHYPTIIAALLILSLSACKVVDNDITDEVMPMKNNADQLKVRCNPAYLEIVNDTISTLWSVVFPAGYFHEKGALRFDAVFVYEKTEKISDEKDTIIVTQLFALKKIVIGEGMHGRYYTIKNGGDSISQLIKFPYKSEMAQGYLELRATLLHNAKEYPFDKPYPLTDSIK